MVTHKILVDAIYSDGFIESCDDCDSNFPCCKCCEQMVTDYEESIRAEERANVLDEIAEAFNEHLFDSPMMNPIMTRNEIILFLEELKEQKAGEQNK